VKKRLTIDIDIDTTPGRGDFLTVLPVWCKSLHYDKDTGTIVMTVGPRVPESLETVDLSMSLLDAERFAAAIEFCRQAAQAALPASSCLPRPVGRRHARAVRAGRRYTRRGRER